MSQKNDRRITDTADIAFLVFIGGDDGAIVVGVMLLCAAPFLLLLGGR